ncbi:MAG: diguanylate cyclase [Longimicrobiales bacterium]
MIWSVQLTPWALPSLLAVLIALRDLDLLWPVRREQGAWPLLSLTVTSGFWAVFHLAVVASASEELKTLFFRLEYVPAALAPVAWAWFALVLSRRRKDLFSPPMFALAAASLVTLWMAVNPDGAGPLLGDRITLQDRGGVYGLVMSHGIWHWVHLGVRGAAVLGATAFLGVHVARVGASGLRVITLASAAGLAILPTAGHTLLTPGSAWTDLAPLGFVLAASLLRWGLLRDRLTGLGPVARAVVMEELRDPVVVLDGKGRIVDVNRAAEEVLDFEVYGDVPVELGTFWAGSRRSGGAAPSRVSLEVSGDGEPKERTFEVTAAYLEGRGSDGRMAMVLRDVTARDRMEKELREARDQAEQANRRLEHANEQLEELANTDSLTGLANRRRFMEKLDAEIERADRYGRDLAIVLADLDHFKEVNDNWGHLVGDDVLRATARALQSVCREVDLAGRLGGEEMALILPETGREGAWSVAERLRRRIEDLRHEAPGGETFEVTASVGVAWLDDEVRTREDLLRAADRALYRAKERGRNQVVVKRRGVLEDEAPPRG